MTHLERLIQAQVESTTVTTLSAATAHVVEEMTREWLKDPAFREELRALIQTHFAATVAQLGKNGARRKQKAAKK